MKTYDYYLKEVTQNGLALSYVPKGLRTYEICLAAVKQDGLALLYVPEELKASVLASIKTLEGFLT